MRCGFFTGRVISSGGGVGLPVAWCGCASPWALLDQLHVHDAVALEGDAVDLRGVARRLDADLVHEPSLATVRLGRVAGERLVVDEDLRVRGSRRDADLDRGGGPRRRGHGEGGDRGWSPPPRSRSATGAGGVPFATCHSTAASTAPAASAAATKSPRLPRAPGSPAWRRCSRRAPRARCTRGCWTQSRRRSRPCPKERTRRRGCCGRSRARPKGWCAARLSGATRRRGARAGSRRSWSSMMPLISARLASNACVTAFARSRGWTRSPRSSRKASSAAARSAAVAYRSSRCVGERLPHDGLERLRRVGVDGARPGDVAREQALEDGDVGDALPQPPARRGLPEHHAHGEDVGAAVDSARRAPARAPCRRPCP